MHPKNILNQAPLGGVHNQNQHPQNPKHPSSTPQAPSWKVRVNPNKPIKFPANQNHFVGTRKLLVDDTMYWWLVQVYFLKMLM